MSKSSKKKNNIRVICRFRPMNDMEQSEGSTMIYSPLTKNGAKIEHPDKAHHPHPMQFYFDRIFGPKAAQVELFEDAASPLIDNMFEGYNATIFAYGQTGSGKTHTMMGDLSKIYEAHPRVGIIPRVVGEIWSRIVNADTNCEFELKVSFLEIYNEEIFDLLGPMTSRSKFKRGKRRNTKQRQKLIIREYSDEVFVEGLNEIFVRDERELLDMIKSAQRQRVQAETKMNRTSSRSHAVLTIMLGQEDTRTGNSKKSKFCLVDLAGSEKVGKTQATGIRLKEATSINKSLTTLGTCMNKLADNHSASASTGSGQHLRHIPFRESVLTRLLSDSLGGNCKTTLIINASPCSYNVEETISTLRFGERAKKITTKARINQIKTPQQYRKELQAAQSEILKLYRIIEDCAYDITQAFRGTLNVDNCKSYRKLLDLRKYTLSIINGTHYHRGTGGSTSSSSSASSSSSTGSRDGTDSASVSGSLLANILPDLTHLQCLKKVRVVKKQQKELGVLENQPLKSERNVSANSVPSPIKGNLSVPTSKATSTPKGNLLQRTKSGGSENAFSISPQRNAFDPLNKLRRPRCGSFEKLDVDNAVKLVRSGQQKKVDPLKKKRDRNDFKVTGTNANAAFQPPNFDRSVFDLNDSINGMSLSQMSMGDYHSNTEVSESEYDTDFQNMGMMPSPAGDGTQSDASHFDVNLFDIGPDTTTPHSGAPSDRVLTDYTDFQEEELPKSFFDMNKEQRMEFAKQRRIDPKLVEFRWQISRKIDWEQWNSDDEEENGNGTIDGVIGSSASSPSPSPSPSSGESIASVARRCEFNRQRLLMLCRLIRSKSQEFGSRIELEMSKYNSLSSKYRAQKEKNSSLMKQNSNLERFYENVVNDKRELQKKADALKRSLEDTTKRMAQYAKQLDLKEEELKVERGRQTAQSHDSNSMLRRQVHEKYAAEYGKIERDVICNESRDIESRFKELATAFQCQSTKYRDLEEAIESRKERIYRLEALMRRRDKEEESLRADLEDQELQRQELVMEHTKEVEELQNSMKQCRTKADMWKRRTLVYKDALNSLMEQEDLCDTDQELKLERDFTTREDDSDSDRNPPSTASSFPLQRTSSMTGSSPVPSRSGNRLKPMRSPRLQAARRSASNLNAIGLNERGSLRTERARKHRTNGRRDGLSSPSSSRRAVSPLREDAFRKTPSQKAALTRVKMKIRGGGGSDDDVYRTPIKRARITGHDTGSFAKRKKMEKSPILKQRRHSVSSHNARSTKHSQPLKGSLPPPKGSGYSSEETPLQIPITHKMRRRRGSLSTVTLNRSRSPVPPVAVGINDLIRSHSVEFDDSPSPFMMAAPRSPLKNEMSAQCRTLTTPRKRATSPLPAPTTLHRRQSTGGSSIRDEASDGDSDFEREFLGNDHDGFLSPHSHSAQFASPAESFFSKVKHAANDSDDDDGLAPRKRVAVSMPEPGATDDDDGEEFDAVYSDNDSSNASEDVVPSFSASSRLRVPGAGSGSMSMSVSVSGSGSGRRVRRRQSVDNTMD